MVCAECMKMCCLGGKNSVVKGLKEKNSAVCLQILTCLGLPELHLSRKSVCAMAEKVPQTRVIIKDAYHILFVSLIIVTLEMAGLLGRRIISSHEHKWEHLHCLSITMWSV